MRTEREPNQVWLWWSLINYSLFALGGLWFVVLGLARSSVAAVVVGLALTTLCVVACLRMRRHPRWHWASY